MGNQELLKQLYGERDLDQMYLERGDTLSAAIDRMNSQIREKQEIDRAKFDMTNPLYGSSDYLSEDVWYLPKEEQDRATQQLLELLTNGRYAERKDLMDRKL